MRRLAVLAIAVVALCFPVGAHAEAISFTHNVYVVSGGPATVSGPAEVTFDEGSSFSGTGTWAGYDWDITGQQTGSDVSYTVTSAGIPGLSVQQTGSSGDFAFAAIYEPYGVSLFTRAGATGWLGLWNQEAHAYFGDYSGTVEITSAENGVLAGHYVTWNGGSDSTTFTGTYSPDGTFQIDVPDWLISYVGAYGTGWHGYVSTSTGDTGYFIDNNIVPEPSALIALLTGLAGAAGFLRRRP